MHFNNLPSSFLILVFSCLFLTNCRTDPAADAPTKAAVVTVQSHIRGEPDRLNAYLTLSRTSRHITEHLYNTLIEFDPFTQELSPVIVKSLPEVVELTEGPYAGGTSFTYEILDEAVWDTGEPVLAKDYLFTIKLIKNPYVAAAAYRGMLKFVEAVEIDPQNPRRFTIYSSEKYIRATYTTGGIYLYPEYFYDPQGLLKDISIAELNGPQDKRSAEAEAKLKLFAERFNSDALSRDSIVSSAAYTLKEWTPNQRVVLERKQNWWGDKVVDKYPMLTAKPKQLVFNIVKESSAAINLMKNGEIDCVTYIEDDLFEELKSNELITENYQLVQSPSTSYQYISLNCRSPKLNDKKVRRALAHLMDVDEVINTIKLGNAKQVVGPIPPYLPYAHRGLKPIPLSIDMAKKLLEQAGWKDSNGDGIVDKMINGEKVELSLSYLTTGTNKVSRAMPLILQKNAREAGIDIKTDVVEIGVLRDRIRKRDYELFSLAAGLDLGLYDFYQHWHTSSDTPSGSNRYGFGNAETDRLIETHRKTLDEKKRNELYKQLQEIIYDEQPAIFLYNTQINIAIHKRLKNAKASIKPPNIHEQYYGGE